MEKKKCDVCGKKFVKRTTWQTSCSAVCRAKKHRDKVRKEAGKRCQ